MIKTAILSPSCWGIPPEAIDGLSDRLFDFWFRYHENFKTKTRDTSEYAQGYLSGQLRMEGNRNYANIGRKTGISEQNMQHFMSNSPWEGSKVIEQVKREIKETPGLERGGYLLLDESGDEKSGEKSAGSGRQYIGRFGKVDIGQVGTFVAYANLTCEVPIWTWIDAELYFPKHWFDEDMKGERKRLGVPEDLKFQTKIELGWKMIERIYLSGFPFEMVCFDALYGNSSWLRFQMRHNNLLYMADISRDTPVYLNKPVLGVSEERKDGNLPKVQVLSTEKPVKVCDLIAQSDFQVVDVRNTERGVLSNPFSVRRVWTVDKERGETTEEWLVIRQESENKYSYSLSNESPETSIERLAFGKCQRYFVERANQEAKSRVGWDEFQAQKYRGWQHQTVFCILSCWFLSETKLDWTRKYPQDPELLQVFETDVLPCLSHGNIQELLRSVMPLPQLTTEESRNLVVKHLINRTRSRKSRMEKEKRKPRMPYP